MEKKGKENSYLHKYSTLNWNGNILELLEFHSWLQHGEMCISEKVTFPSRAMEKYSKYLCYVTGVSALEECATDACSELPAYTQKCFSDIPRIRNSMSGGCGHK